ncbi:hypothetical protein BX589_11272 [Paraburkholderia fungorum]|nr:hypothetical protein BX589_11272 [Paraburkholderia fungorum]
MSGHCTRSYLYDKVVFACFFTRRYVSSATSPEHSSKALTK